MNSAKAVLRLKFIELNAYIKNISNKQPNSYLKKLEKEQAKPKVSRRKKK